MRRPQRPLHADSGSGNNGHRHPQPGSRQTRALGGAPPLTKEQLLKLGGKVHIKPRAMVEIPGVTLDDPLKPFNLLPKEERDEPIEPFNASRLYHHGRGGKHHHRNSTTDSASSGRGAGRRPWESRRGNKGGNWSAGGRSEEKQRDRFHVGKEDGGLSQTLGKWRSQRVQALKTEEVIGKHVSALQGGGLDRGAFRARNDNPTKESQVGKPPENAPPSESEGGQLPPGFEVEAEQPAKPRPRPARQWYYKDPQGNERGPFLDEMMRDWYSKGFFKLNLPVSTDLSKPFAPLGTWFLMGNPAFLHHVPELLAKNDAPQEASGGSSFDPGVPMHPAGASSDPASPFAPQLFSAPIPQDSGDGTPIVMNSWGVNRGADGGVDGGMPNAGRRDPLEPHARMQTRPPLYRPEGPGTGIRGPPHPAWGRDMDKVSDPHPSAPENRRVWTGRLGGMLSPVQHPTMPAQRSVDGRSEPNFRFVEGSSPSLNPTAWARPLNQGRGLENPVLPGMPGVTGPRMAATGSFGTPLSGGQPINAFPLEPKMPPGDQKVLDISSRLQMHGGREPATQISMLDRIRKMKDMDSQAHLPDAHLKRSNPPAATHQQLMGVDQSLKQDTMGTDPSSRGLLFAVTQSNVDKNAPREPKTQHGNPRQEAHAVRDFSHSGPTPKPSEPSQEIKTPLEKENPAQKQAKPVQFGKSPSKRPGPGPAAIPKRQTAPKTSDSTQLKSEAQPSKKPAEAINVNQKKSAKAPTKAKKPRPASPPVAKPKKQLVRNAAVANVAPKKPLRRPGIGAPAKSWGSAGTARQKTFEEILKEEAEREKVLAIQREKTRAFEEQRLQQARLAASQNGGYAWGRVRAPVRNASLEKIQSEQLSKVATAAPRPAVAAQSRPEAAPSQGSAWGGVSRPSQPTSFSELLRQQEPSVTPMPVKRAPVTQPSKPATERKEESSAGGGMFWETDDNASAESKHATNKTGSQGVASKSSSSSGTQGRRRRKKGGNEFGGPVMSKEFEDWCKMHLEKLVGSPDTTLVNFLMGVDSESEIREHLYTYLGKSKEVKEFAAGFIQQKDFQRKKTHTVKSSSSSSSGMTERAKPSPSIASSGSFGVLSVQASQPSNASDTGATGKKKRSSRRRRKKR